jgi:hypothetical protein
MTGNAAYPGLTAEITCPRITGTITNGSPSAAVIGASSQDMPGFMDFLTDVLGDAFVDEFGDFLTDVE